MYNRIAGYEKFPMLYWYAVWADCNSVMEYMHRDAVPYMAGSMSGLNSERSYTLLGFFDSSSRRRERSWSK